MTCLHTRTASLSDLLYNYMVAYLCYQQWVLSSWCTEPCSPKSSHAQTRTQVSNAKHCLYAYADSVSNATQLVQSQDRGMLQLPTASSNRATADIAPTPSQAEANSIIPCGITKHVVEQLPPKGSRLIDVSFLALSAGVHQLSGLALQDIDSSRVYDQLQPVDILVQA